MMTLFLVPSLAGTWLILVQLVVVRVSFSSKAKPVAGDGHERNTVLVEVD
jgi:hypothetical protein